MMLLLFEATNVEKTEEDHINKNYSNYTLTIKSYNDFEFMTQKKTFIIFILLIICVVGGLIVTYVNVNDDFNQLQMFYVGYMGRILVGREIMKDDNQAREYLGNAEDHVPVHMIIFNGESDN